MEVDEKVSEEKKDDNNNQSNRLGIIKYPNFDVSKYASNYTSKIKIDRLIHIAQICPMFQRESFKIAVNEVKDGKILDVGMYDRVMESAQKVLGVEQCKFDAQWMAKQGQQNEKQVRYLEDEIQRWRNLSNRERICSSYLAAAEYCVSIGSWNTAISRYIEAKSYAGDTKMLLDINLKIMITSIKSGQFGHVKSEASHAIASDEIYKDNVIRSKVLCCLGLYHLYHQRYDAAVSMFIDCHFSVYNKLKEIVSGKDIALYGGLCALASFSRTQLKKNVLDNVEFKRFLELTPKVSSLVRAFYDSEYGKVMAGLQSLKNDMLIDIYLYRCCEHLLTSIRGKALVQYFSPYSAMDINKMAESFRVPIDEMEKELSTCIGDNHIKAKIDSHNKIVYASTQNRRNDLFQSVLNVGDEFQRDMKAVLLRSSLIQNNVIVSQARDEWFNEYESNEPESSGIMGMMGGMGRKFANFGGGGSRNQRSQRRGGRGGKYRGKH